MEFNVVQALGFFVCLFKLSGASLVFSSFGSVGFPWLTVDILVPFLGPGIS